MVITFILLGAAVDYYIYRAIRQRQSRRIYSRLYAWQAVAMVLYLVVAICLPRRSGSDTTLLAIMWMLFGYMTVYIPKYVFVLVDLIAKIPQLFKRRRIKAISWTGIGLAVVIFFGMWWGALVNRFQTDVREVEYVVPGLPKSLDGYRIVQISDLHTGTYGDDNAFLGKIVDEVNSLRPDAVFFTGDIVNRKSDELTPHASTLAGLRARDGVFSILGNHDYGDYTDWASPEAKRENMELLYRLQREMGWRLLRNETAKISRAPGDTLYIIGVENIGDPPFPRYGSLEKAYPTPGDSRPKILLTHNPAHWVEDIADNDSTNIALTLSGHTHAMQISLLGLSPAAFRYKTWGGGYDDQKKETQRLYVNIGAGTVGLPMRLGATPEITVITLLSK